ncbi:MAG: PAS domain-containing protein, partial [Clostridia bacterium]|nr:PAS domain-containing protein [Clostridia bacterium]
MNYLSPDKIEKYLLESLTGFWEFEAEDGVAVRMYVDKNMQRLIGVPDSASPEECMTFFQSHIHPDDMPLMEAYSENMMRGNAEIEYRYMHPTAGEIYVRCSGRRVAVKDNVVTFAGHHIELADTVRVEKDTSSEELLVRRSRDLQHNETRYYFRNMLNNAACGIVVYTAEDHQLQYMNAEALRIYGSDNIDEIQKNVGKVNFVRMGKDTVREYKKMLSENGGIDYECIITGINSVETQAIVHSEAVVSPLGERTICSTILDVSENKVLSDSLKAAEEANRIKDTQMAVIRALAIPYENTYEVNGYTGETICHSMSKTSEEAYGGAYKGEPFEDSLRKYSQSVVLEEDRHLFDEIRFLPKALEILKEKKIHTFYYRILRNGKIEYFQCMMVMPDADKKAFVIAFRNVSEEKRKEYEQERLLNLRLQTISEAIHGGFKITRNDEVFSFVTVSKQLAQLLGY